METSRPIGAIGPGSVVAGRYEIREVLGAGGMAIVYRAHDRALDVGLALKVLKASPSRDPELAARFRSEIKLAWRVRHRNVCGIHEYGEAGDVLYISMELVDGWDLSRLLRDKGPLIWEEAYDVTIQIAEGLEAIHQAGVVHRDLKPSNIMQDQRGLVRLMDFGIAKVWGDDTGGGAMRTGYLVGSPAYMSPEQVRGASVDFRSDLYALGLVSYELFTARLAFAGDTPSVVMMRRLDEDPDWEGPAARRIPAGALPILRKALAREPVARYSSCGEILKDLRAARAALSSQATDEPGRRAGEPETATGPPRSGPAPVMAAFSREAQTLVLVPPLLRAAKHADRSVRLGAVEALGRLAGEAQLPADFVGRVAEVLETARRDEDERVVAAAAASIARLERPAAESGQPPALEAERFSTFSLPGISWGTTGRHRPTRALVLVVALVAALALAYVLSGL